MFKQVPNILTALRCLITIFIIYMWFIGASNDTILLRFVLARVTDFFDGVIARKFSLQTKFGKEFDHYADKFLILSIFIIIAVKLFPYNTVMNLSILLMIIILIVRDVYIGRFKTVHTNLPSLRLAKRKATLQGVAIILYFLGSIVLSFWFFVAAVLASVVSGYGYRALAMGGRGTMDSVKIKSFKDVFLGKRKFLTRLSTFPTVYVFKEVVGPTVDTAIVDLDGTVVPFNKEMTDSVDQTLKTYQNEGINIVIYSNNPNKERLLRIRERGFDVYVGSFAKPHLAGYQEVVDEFGITLSSSVMIGDSPVSDLPYAYPQPMYGSILIKPIVPKGFEILPWVHYFFSSFLQLFAKVES